MVPLTWRLTGVMNDGPWFELYVHVSLSPLSMSICTFDTSARAFVARVSDASLNTHGSSFVTLIAVGELRIATDWPDMSALIMTGSSPTGALTVNFPTRHPANWRLWKLPRFFSTVRLARVLAWEIVWVYGVAVPLTASVPIAATSSGIALLGNRGPSIVPRFFASPCKL